MPCRRQLSAFIMPAARAFTIAMICAPAPPAGEAEICVASAVRPIGKRTLLKNGANQGARQAPG